jgi:hypothetical protein
MLEAVMPIAATISSKRENAQIYIIDEQQQLA